MTFTTTPARSADALKTSGLRTLLDWLKGLMACIGLAARLDRLNDRQLQDAGLHRSDIE